MGVYVSFLEVPGKRKPKASMLVWGYYLSHTPQVQCQKNSLMTGLIMLFHTPWFFWYNSQFHIDSCAPVIDVT